MKKILLLPVLFLFLMSWITYGCNSTTKTEQETEPVAADSIEDSIKDSIEDSIDIYARLKPNEEGDSSQHTYGKDRVPGHTFKYRMDTDSSSIYASFDITLLELHPEITAHILSFIHSEMLYWGFINSADTIVPFSIKKLTNKGLSQLDIVKKALKWESKLYYREVPNMIEYSFMGYNFNMEIYPVFLNEDYVTYRLYGYYYTGGAHGNDTSLLQTYNLKTGEPVKLEDIIIPEKVDILRESVVRHMAANYPINSSGNSVESYLDSLNNWLGSIDDILKNDGRERITLKNYPLGNLAIHNTGLVFTYEKYQLTPGINGCPVILVPFDEICSCLKEPFCSLK